MDRALPAPPLRHLTTPSSALVVQAFQAVHSSNNKYVQAPSAYIDRFFRIAPEAERCGQYELPMQQGQSCTKRGMRRTIAAAVAALDDAIGKRHAKF